MSRLQQYLEMAEDDDNKLAQLTSSERQDLRRRLRLFVNNDNPKIEPPVSYTTLIDYYCNVFGHNKHGYLKLDFGDEKVKEKMKNMAKDLLEFLDQ